MSKAELATISSLLETGDINVLYSSGIDDLFVGYRDVWETIKAYYTQYRTLPPANILQQEHKDFEKIEVNGATEYYVDKLRSAFIDRRTKEIMAMGALKRKEGMPPEQVAANMTAAFTKLNRIAAKSSDTDILDFEEAERYYDDVRARTAAGGGVLGIPTGIEFVDSSMPTGGMMPGHLVILFGFPARGKSFIQAFMAANALAGGFKPLIISLEMGAAQVRDRIYPILSSGLFKTNELAVGDFEQDSFAKFKANHENNRGFVVVNNDSANEVTPLLIEAKIDEHKPDIVFLDYLQICSDISRSENMTSKMLNLSRELKMLAERKGIPIVAISSATAESASAKAMEVVPGEAQMGYSRGIVYNADMILAVHKHTNTNLIEIMGRKNRNGPLPGGNLKVDLSAGSFEVVYDMFEDD